MKFTREQAERLIERVVIRLVEDDMSDTVPPSQDPMAVAAGKELAGKNTRNPKAAPMSQATTKTNAVRKELETMGYISDKAKAKHVTQALPGWMAGLDPADALVSTAKELAQRFAGGETAP